jgi:hypothetical protein
MIAILTVQAAQLIALVVLTIVGWRALRGVLRSLDGVAGTLASVLRSLAEIDARLGALEAAKNGSDGLDPRRDRASHAEARQQ